ncbi:hypothetical protein LTR28_003509, partial [Elasticomyces elasticus]
MSCPPMSPGTQRRVYWDTRPQLYVHQEDFYTGRTSPAGWSTIDKPVSPRLAPLGSPGPVTPLELEGQEGYLVAGFSDGVSTATADELVDRLVAEEVRRSGAPGSPRTGII